MELNQSADPADREAKFGAGESPLDLIGGLVRSEKYRQQPDADPRLTDRAASDAVATVADVVIPDSWAASDFDAIGQRFRGDGRSAAGRFTRKLFWAVLHPLVRMALEERDRLDKVLTARTRAEIAPVRQQLERKTAPLSATLRELAFRRDSLHKDQAALAARLLSMEEALSHGAAKLVSVEEALSHGAAKLVSVEEALAVVMRTAVAPSVTTQPFEDVHLNLTTGPYGRFLTMVPDLIGAALERGEFWDAHLRPIIERHANPSRTAIDAGAYIGFHTVFLSRHFRRVVSFEPQTRCFRLLNANVELNGCANVRTYNAPLYDEEVGMALADADLQQISLPMLDDDVNYTTIGNAAALAFSRVADGAPATVQAMTIDSLGLQDVGFIKVDTQGCDLRVLRGARQTIAACRPTIVFEFEKELASLQGDTLEDFKAFFSETGYFLVETAHSGANQWDFLALPKI